MKKIDNKEFREIIQSGHINFLIGSGCSKPFLPTLGNIEAEMNDPTKEINAKKKYYNLIKQSKAILNESLAQEEKDREKLINTQNQYELFLGFWANIISRRSLQIVNKQINIFTTNFDMFLENSCENIGIPYNDGFSGQINSNFKVENFNKIIKYKSLQFDNTSDIPLFNIIKLHGSISWKENDNKIFYSDGSHIADDLDTKIESKFKREYDHISVINPNAEKHFETVLDIKYAAMLRKFTLELEKENSVLIILGQSLEDKHIKNLLYGVMETNPTLVVIYFSYSEYQDKDDRFEEKKYPNLYIISPEDKFSFEKSTNYLSDIFNGAKSSEDEK